MARREIAKKTWDEVKTKSQAGTPISQLAREYGISKGTISDKAKKDGWESIEQEIIDIVNCNNNIKQSIERIEQRIEPSQISIVEKIVAKQTLLQFNLLGLLNQGMSGISSILSEAESLPIDARARIYRDVGLNISELAKASGLNKESKDTNIQINNDQQDKVQINIIGE